MNTDTNKRAGFREEGPAPSRWKSAGRGIGKKLSAVALTALVVGSGLNAGAAFAEGGGGGVPGTGGGVAGAHQIYRFFYDDYKADGDYAQGRMGASTDWFIKQNGGTPGKLGAVQVAAACSAAINKAETRAKAAGLPAGTSRVVGMVWTGSAADRFAPDASASASFYQDQWDQWNAEGSPGIFTHARPYMNDPWNEGLSEGGATPAAVCIALNDAEPPRNYTLSITTDKGATFSLAGSTNAVNDIIHASNGGSSIKEILAGQVVLNWDGVEGTPKQVSKNVQIANQGDTTSPNFTPADFGWAAWPAGKFWFDVKVAKQGKSANAVDTPDRDPRETWTAAPTPPKKKLTSGIPADALKDEEVLASGMFYNAEVTARTNGYASSMTIVDTILSDKVWIGTDKADDASKAYVLAPDGTKVAGAKIAIDRSKGGRVTVRGTVENIPNQFQALEYKLVVPTYLLPTKADYTVKDDSSVCYTRNMNSCIDGNSEQVRKVTPKPDKVWVLDENGALAAADPNHTNAQGADNKVFLMGDAVSAVVNGRIPGKLAENFTKYQIVDDWTKAAKYVDFSDAAKAKVFYETGVGTGKYTDVTAQFDVKVSGTVTTATAKKDFLAKTKGLAGDRKVKLTVTGAFRTDYDTNGETVILHNAGHEVWNNETIPTNEPPVYTWTPDPNKQVVGSAEESGDNAHENINGMSVWPGQKLEYSIGVDLRIPEGTARGVKSLAVEDVHDPLFTPDKDSVQFWDSRDVKNPKPVPRSAYKLSFNAAENKFTATFTQKWIDQNVNVSGANSQWLTKGWLTMRFTGTVKDNAPGGSTVKNQAFQIINDARTATEIPEVEIPTVTPEKEDLNTDLIDIDGKTVVKGDIILYRLTLDGGPDRSKLAYNVHKLGMVDDFDEEYLDLEETDIKVSEKDTGIDVTGKFNVQVKDGIAYVFAKQVDSENVYGDLIKGDPQPKDLAAYDKAPILPHETPIIDQALLGKDYWITLKTTVKKVTDGYVIENQARQNIQNTHYQTKIVSNPLKDINPDKDVVVSEETGDNSINESEIALNGIFNYRLNSSEIPANRAYKASQWSMSDTFDRVHDSFTGIWAIYANTDVYDGEELVFKKGALLQDSAEHESENWKGLFEVAFDEDTYTLNVQATQKYLDLVNTRMDLPNAFSVYTKMERIAPSEKVDNKVIETYNNVDRDSNIVWTHTPEDPAIELVKYTLHEGFKDGDRNKESEALKLTEKELKNGVEVGIKISNTGNVALKNVQLTDKTHKDRQGTVENIVCEIPAPAAEGAETPGDGALVWVPATGLTELAVGETVDCKGTLTGMKVDGVHTDTATVTGESVFTGKKVTASDPWNAKSPKSNPIVEIIEESPIVKLAETGGPGAYAMYVTALALLAGGLLTGVMGLRRRKLQSVAAEAGNEVNAE